MLDSDLFWVDFQNMECGGDPDAVSEILSMLETFDALSPHVGDKSVLHNGILLCRIVLAMLDPQNATAPPNHQEDC